MARYESDSDAAQATKLPKATVYHRRWFNRLGAILGRLVDTFKCICQYRLESNCISLGELCVLLCACAAWWWLWL